MVVQGAGFEIQSVELVWVLLLWGFGELRKVAILRENWREGGRVKQVRRYHGSGKDLTGIDELVTC